MEHAWDDGPYGPVVLHVVKSAPVTNGPIGVAKLEEAPDAFVAVTRATTYRWSAT